MLHKETQNDCPNLRPYSCVIFDLDGTLLNTLEDLTDSVNYALTACGYPLRTPDEIRSFVGNGAGNLIRRSVPDGTNESDIENCLRIKREYYRMHCQDKTSPYDGILELLIYLKSLHIKTAVVSNKGEAAVKVLCQKYFPDLIDVCIGDSKERKKKPAPDGILEVLGILHCQKDSALYIGDSDVDMDTAKNAGLSCVGVTWGFRSRELLKAHGADYIIDAPVQLKALILEEAKTPTSIIGD